MARVHGKVGVAGGHQSSVVLAVRSTERVIGFVARPAKFDRSLTVGSPTAVFV